MSNVIHIDGSQGEGGGQVVRTALSLSMLTGQPIHLLNIRAKRRNPGLAPQHLAGVLAAAQICDADVKGAQLRATEITFHPGSPARPGRYVFDISHMVGQSSAGAVTLLLQTVLLPLALADGPSHLILRGGTHVAWSPPVHYVSGVLLPTLARMGLQVSIVLHTWGWYPQGGGHVEVTLQGKTQLTGLDLTQRGNLVALEGVAAVSHLPSHISQRIASRANNLLRETGLPALIQPTHAKSPATGAGLFVTLAYDHGVYAGFSALGEKGKPSDVVASEAIEALISYHFQPAALDRYLPDQILPALALATGPSALSTVEITQHMLTNVAITRRFIHRPISIEGTEGRPGAIYVEANSPDC